MNYNIFLEILRSYCKTKSAEYHRDYESYGGITYMKYKYSELLCHNLEKITDIDFKSATTFADMVIKTILETAEVVKKDAQNRAASVIIDKESEKVKDYLMSIDASQAVPRLPYRRVLIGDEKEYVMEQASKIYNFNGSYFYPLDNNAVHREDCLFIMCGIAKPFEKEILQLFSDTHFYEYGESNYENGFGVAEVDDLSLEFSGCETAYISKDFSWIVYISHEGTITFGGSILYDVKRILKPKQEYWNIYNENWVYAVDFYE